MREEPNNCSGTSFFLEQPEDLQRLDPSLATLIPPRLKDLFLQPAVGLRTLASRASFKPLRQWLEDVSHNRCELGIHTPGDHWLDMGYPSEVFLEIRPIENQRGYLISGAIDDVPQRCPATLAEVLSLVGVIAFEYGDVERLLRPSQQRSLPDLCEEVRRIQRQFSDRISPTPLLDDDQFRQILDGVLGPGPIRYRDPLERIVLPDDVDQYHSFYRDDFGGWIATNPRGLTFHSGHQPGPPIDEFLTTLFEGRLRGERGTSFSD